jgi:hypothetical protein
MAKKKPKPGPAAQRLRLTGNWQDNVRQSLQKKKPVSGWPKPKK